MFNFISFYCEVDLAIAWAPAFTSEALGLQVCTTVASFTVPNLVSPHGALPAYLQTLSSGL